MLRLKLALIISLPLIYSAPALSTTTPTVTKKTDIISCVESNGSLAHKLSQSTDGHYLAYISMPVHYKKISAEGLEASKKRWAEWDGVSAPPQDIRTIGTSVPLESGSVFNFDIERLTEKAKFFDSLFPPVANSAYIPQGFGSFLIDYKSDECQVTESGKLMKVYCSNTDTIKINNVVIKQRLLEMSSEVATEVVFNPDNGKTEILNTPKVKVSLTLKATEGLNIKNFRSSYTYLPNDNEKPCFVRDQKLLAK